MSEIVSLRIEAGIGGVSLDHPPMNVMSRRLCMQLVSCLDSAFRQPLKAILRTGIGRVFCAGADLTELADGALPPPPDPNILHGMCLGVALN